MANKNRLVEFAEANDPLVIRFPPRADLEPVFVDGRLRRLERRTMLGHLRGVIVTTVRGCLKTIRKNVELSHIPFAPGGENQSRLVRGLEKNAPAGEFATIANLCSVTIEVTLVLEHVVEVRPEMNPRHGAHQKPSLPPRERDSRDYLEKRTGFRQHEASREFEMLRAPHAGDRILRRFHTHELDSLRLASIFIAEPTIHFLIEIAMERGSYKPLVHAISR